MTADNRPIGDLSTSTADRDRSYHQDARLGDAGEFSWESDQWRGFFTGVARRVVGLVEPATALDVGCANGMLVQALVAQGVDARGSDISEFAIAAAHPEVADRLAVASVAEPIKGHYDLITCVEVLEHLSPGDAQRAIDSMCSATDRVLFSSTPPDSEEATHVNVHPTAQWAAWFAERGFFRRTDADTSFLTPWSILFERADLSKHAIVSRYEEQFAPLHQEVLDKRRVLLEVNRAIAELERVPREVADRDASILARHAALVARDNVIGLEAQVATLQNQLAEVRRRLQTARDRLQERNQEIADLRASRSWRLGRAMMKPIAWLKR